MAPHRRRRRNIAPPLREEAAPAELACDVLSGHPKLNGLGAVSFEVGERRLGTWFVCPEQ